MYTLPCFAVAVACQRKTYNVCMTIRTCLRRLGADRHPACRYSAWLAENSQETIRGQIEFYRDKVPYRLVPR